MSPQSLKEPNGLPQVTPPKVSVEIQLKCKTSPKWIDVVLENFNEFLLDHAACERKASATAMQFVVRYPDRPLLIDPLIRLAREELLHFHQVVRLVLARKLQLTGDQKTPYVNLFLKHVRHGRNEHFLDRLLCFGLIEARGTERFGLVAEHIQNPQLKEFYRKLAEAEARHHHLFVELAQIYFPQDVIQDRIETLSQQEAEILSNLDIRPAVH